MCLFVFVFHTQREISMLALLTVGAALVLKTPATPKPKLHANPNPNPNPSPNPNPNPNPVAGGGGIFTASKRGYGHAGRTTLFSPRMPRTIELRWSELDN